MLYSSCIIIFRDSDPSFSSICFLGIIPARRSLNIIAMYAHVISSSLQFFMGSTSITLLSISTITMMYLLPRCECVESCPVWSDNTVFLNFYMLVYTSRALFPCSVDFLGTSRGVLLGLLDLKSFLIGSDVLLASHWSLGNIWQRCVRLASDILRSYPL